jgi:hypothetical protein
MKKVFLVLSLIVGQAAFAGLKLDCQNADGSVQLVSTKPCDKCDSNKPAFDFIGGNGILAAGIPEYDSEMPGYIDFDGDASKPKKQDIISLIDGGTWWITMYFPPGFLKADHKAGEKVQATMDSSYDDIDESELNGVQLDCTVQ